MEMEVKILRSWECASNFHHDLILQGLLYDGWNVYHMDCVTHGDGSVETVTMLMRVKPVAQ